MAFVSADRVSDTTTVTGTGNVTVSGVAPTGYRTLSAVLSVGDTFYYCISDQTNGKWETGTGTYVSANVFARTTVLSSSNSGSLVAFTDGTKTVFVTFPAAQMLQTTPGTVGASSIRAVATGSTTARTMAARFADAANVLDYGASSSASAAANSTAFNAAMTSGKSTVIIPPGSYTVYNVNIPNGVCVFAFGAYFTDAAGADYIFQLTGYNPRLFGAYISSATNCSQAAIVLNDAIYSFVTDISIINSANGILLKWTSSGYGCNKNNFSNINVNTYTGYGLKLTSGCSQNNFSNCTFDPGQAAGTGGYKPKTGSYGVVFDASASQALAFGGNLFSNCVAINPEIGWHFYYATLNQFVNCVADNCSGPGFNFPNYATRLDFSNCFVGVCSSAVYVSGVNNNSLKFVGLRTVDIGVIPSGGGSDYYTSAGYASPYYEIVQKNSGYVTVDANTWIASGTNAHSFSEQNEGYAQFIGGVIFSFNSNGTIAAGTTVYLGLNGQSATEDSQLTVMSSYYTICNAAKAIILTNNAPGAGQTYTYSIRKNSADSGITGVISGASSFQATMSGGPVSFGPNHSIDLKVTTSATAALATHRGYILLLPQPA